MRADRGEGQSRVLHGRREPGLREVGALQDEKDRPRFGRGGCGRQETRGDGDDGDERDERADENAELASSARVDPADRLEGAERKRDSGTELRLARVDPHEGPSGGARGPFREHPHRRDVRSRSELEDDERSLHGVEPVSRASRAARRSARRPTPCLRTSGCSGGRGRGRKGRTAVADVPGRWPRRPRPGFRPRSGSARRSCAGTGGSGSSRGTRRSGSRRTRPSGTARRRST